MSYKTRKRIAILVLIFGLPIYIVAATTLVNQFERPHILVELAIYVGLGVLWALPLKRLFRGLGQPDPDADQP